MHNDLPRLLCLRASVASTQSRPCKVWAQCIPHCFWLRSVLFSLFVAVTAFLTQGTILLLFYSHFLVTNLPSPYPFHSSLEANFGLHQGLWRTNRKIPERMSWRSVALPCSLAHPMEWLWSAAVTMAVHWRRDPTTLASMGNMPSGCFSAKPEFHVSEQLSGGQVGVKQGS
jgi:hypothetical protein